MSQLKIIQFGDKLLRGKAQLLKPSEIASTRSQQFIKDMRAMLLNEKLGIGLAAPQVGKSVALVVIAIRPSKIRPDAKPFDLIAINPEITKYAGKKKPEWEGCISSGSNGKADVFAKVPRYAEVRVKYYDERGTQHHKSFKGLRAQVLQHEIDHLQGILMVDRVEDTKTYMTYKEYLKMRRAELKVL